MGKPIEKTREGHAQAQAPRQAWHPLPSMGKPVEKTGEGLHHHAQAQAPSQRFQLPSVGKPVEKNSSYNCNSSPLRIAEHIIACKLHETVARQNLEKHSWVIDIRDNLARARAGAEAARVAWGRCCVNRVPRWLRERDQRAYTPQVVSIGPLHHGGRRLREMEAHKWRALDHALQRTGRDVAELATAVRAVEGEARDCYEGRAAWMPSDELVRCLVLDGTFVLEMFRGVAGDGSGFVGTLGYQRNDPVFAMRSLLHAVRGDMILLENQLPLLVLERLLGLLLQPAGSQPELTRGGGVARLAERFFDPLRPTSMLHQNSYGRSGGDWTAVFDPLSRPMLHGLDVFRRSLLRPSPTARPPPPCVADKRRQQLVHCVSELREAGVRFQPRRDTAGCSFLDIKFVDGVLHIPRMLIHDGTKSVLLNLVAFEQCHMGSMDAPRGNNITMYAIFMDNLINSAEDVRHLQRRGIIEHWLGSDADVARLFNRLCEEVVFDIEDSYLSELSDQVNRYYEDRWSTWIASLKHNYFSNPWTIISLVAGVSLLLLTVTQTFYTVYGYYHPVH